MDDFELRLKIPMESYGYMIHLLNLMFNQDLVYAQHAYREAGDSHNTYDTKYVVEYIGLHRLVRGNGSKALIPSLPHLGEEHP